MRALSTGAADETANGPVVASVRPCMGEKLHCQTSTSLLRERVNALSEPLALTLLCFAVSDFACACLPAAASC